jgi:hypothetical protein
MYDPSSQKIVLDNTTSYGAGYWNQIDTPSPQPDPDAPANTSGTPTDTRKPLTIIAAAVPPAGWTATSNIGISISEPTPNAPLGYYQEPNYTYPTYPMRDGFQNTTTMIAELPDQPFDTIPGMPLQVANLLSTDTTVNFKTAYLQRLANPLQPYNAVQNPYITIDWMPLDLTVFNGEEDVDAKGTAQTLGTLKAGFRQKDGDGLGKYNLWSQQCAALDTSLPGTNVNDWFNLGLVNFSLGYLNNKMGTVLTPPNPTFLGDPAGPFPWMTWLNRPYTSPYELLTVPAVTQSRLMQEYSSSSATSPYVPTASYDKAFGPFPHLLNFFETNGTGAIAGSELYRIFDVIEVPSAFVGSEKWLNPATFSTGTGPEYTHLRPPFNRISRFRDPGRININTITNSEVWDSIRRSYPDIPDWTTVSTSRSGTNTTVAGITQQFRTSASADLAPVGTGLRNTAVQKGLLRGSADPPVTPLFNFTHGTRTYLDSTKTPYFKYQELQHLGNLLTNHSNVFGVWITVGYFEVEPNPGGIDLGHPDGYRLGKELGSESGGISRHRAFYIIDRSVPVGFVPGENINSDRAVLLRRYIE